MSDDSPPTKPARKKKKSPPPKPPRGKLTEKNVRAQIKKLNGNLTKVGIALGVDRTSVRDFVSSRHDLIQWLHDCRVGRIVDDAVDGVGEAIKNREPWAIKFTLLTQGGWVEKTTHEHTGPGGKPIESRTEHHGKVGLELSQVQQALADGEAAIAAAVSREIEERLAATDDPAKSADPVRGEEPAPERGDEMG